MCLLLFAYRTHPGYPLIVAANRDEFHGREAEPAHWWDDPPILAGRDLEAGGTWLGVSREGRFAAVTNYRDPSVREPGFSSRGELPVRALRPAGDDDLIRSLRDEGGRYNGFNLLFGDPDRLCYVSNRGDPRQRLAPGLYGLSNGVLEEDWPKVRRGKDRLAAYLRETPRPDAHALLDLLRDRRRPSDDELPDTGIGLEWERVLAPMFIVTERYGTRSSTVLLMADDGGIEFLERRFGSDGEPVGDIHERFRASARGP